MNNSWHEKGELPPFSTECEYTIGNNFGGFKPCFLVGINSRGSVVIENDSGEFKCFHKHQIKFRPLKTERERFVEAAVKVISGGDSELLAHIFNTPKDAAEKLYDAGFKAPEVVE